jgi:nucleoside-diphosphate-sugar epimerase
MSRVLITGSTGFVGQHIVPHMIAEGFKVDTVNRTGNTVNDIDQNWSWEELEQIDFTRYEAVIHLTCKAHDSHHQDDYEQYRQINVALLEQLLAACQTLPPKRIILLSTIKVYGSDVSSIDDETLTPNPDSVYGRTKLEAEQLLLEAQLVTTAKIILRPTLIFGQPFKGNLATFERLIKRKLPLPLWGLNNQRSYLAIDNLKYIITSILKNADFQSGTYHLADDAPLSTPQLADCIALTLSLKKKPFKLPYQLLYPLALMGQLTGRGFDLIAYRKVTSDLIVDNNKIKEALGIILLVLAKGR